MNDFEAAAKAMHRKPVTIVRKRQAVDGAGVSAANQIVVDVADAKYEAHGVKGMNSTQWRKEFKSYEEAEKWANKNDAEIQGFRETEGSAKDTQEGRWKDPHEQKENDDAAGSEEESTQLVNVQYDPKRQPRPGEDETEPKKDPDDGGEPYDEYERRTRGVSKDAREPKTDLEKERGSTRTTKEDREKQQAAWKKEQERAFARQSSK